jgi:hypothetical protein
VLAWGLSAAGGVWAQTQVVVPQRIWQSAEGKEVSGEVLGFEEDLVLLRTPDGRRFSVPEDRFSLADRGELLRARILNSLRESYSEPIGTSFFQVTIPIHQQLHLLRSAPAAAPNRQLE